MVKGDCVEAASLLDRTGVRDSKDPAGPVVAFNFEAWSAFVADVKRDAFRAV
nr:MULTISPECIES: DUF397 domain-containing protein [unclassified Streptomyces]